VYKAHGYTPVGLGKPKVDAPVGKTEPETETEPEAPNIERQSIAYKPISQWTRAELEEYADKAGLDRKARDLRKLVKEALDNGIVG